MASLIQDGVLVRFESSHADVVEEVQLMAQSLGAEHREAAPEETPSATISFLTRLFARDKDRDLAA